ncbi:response regulator [Sphingomonas sp. PB2P12]|uniref:response regulator n=1 Tax=Sphingomonas sandaracina TaxID=3096157 RepID=UPI002FC65FFB
MHEMPLAGARILVVEDEYYLAEEVSSILARIGAEILGPVPTVDQANALIAANPRIDGAVLDVNLRGELVFDLADALHARGVPFAFATGYDGDALPHRFADRVVLVKPVRPDALVEALGALVAETRSRE